MSEKNSGRKAGHHNWDVVFFKVARMLLYVMPACLYLSYWPVISFGKSETMNFELSVPLIWLVVFDAVVLVAMINKRVLFEWLKGKRWLWLLFPVWATLSLIWSVNVTRGVLTVGIMWLIVFAGYGMWALRDLWDEAFRRVWWKWFVGATLVVCGWCFLQCILDLAGVPQDYSLMCDGCTYRMFGFPHPNGFAIEPQFMGNLLLAPAIITCYFLIKKRFSWRLVLCCAMIASTLFLTFSRGAIYAFVIGLVVMTVGVLVDKRHKIKAKRVWGAWGIVVCSFLLILNIQGLMAQLGPTSDTYMIGVRKVINHLSLGVVDLPVENSVEKPVENFENNRGESESDELIGPRPEEAEFDGYVAESTDIRLKLTNVAVEAWSRDARTVLFGVGIGGAGQALYNAGLSPSPKEIVQNQYASLLLETGLVGISLAALLIGLAVRVVWKNQPRWLVISLMMAYGISLFFFSGFANALQIYLLVIWFLLIVV